MKMSDVFCIQSNRRLLTIIMYRDQYQRNSAHQGERETKRCRCSLMLIKIIIHRLRVLTADCD